MCIYSPLFYFHKESGSITRSAIFKSLIRIVLCIEFKVKPKSVEEKTQNEQTRHLDLPIQAVIKPIETKKIRKIPNLVKDHLKQKTNNKISKSQKQVPKITEGNKV